jgi:hypothetical protein
MFNAKQEAGHNLKIKYDWFYPGMGSDGKTPKLDWREEDSGQLKEWTLIQVEGEEPQPVAEVVAEPAKGKAKPPAKGKAVEEPTDNRPRII